jgi:uncharacterized protein YdeI (YjbR/CyaY-like superfamily)
MNAQGGRGSRDDPVFFATPQEFRAWLEAHHAERRELWVGLHKKRTGLPSLTWSQAVDEALCFGWIDGQGKSLGETSHMIRFSPRKKGSSWSAVNVRRVGELLAEGRMRPAGLAAFEQRSDARTGIYSHEQEGMPELGEAFERQFRADAAAWDFFQTRPRSYRKAAIWWVVSAKREETRQKRLATLIADSAQGRTVKPLTPPGKTR